VPRPPLEIRGSIPGDFAYSTPGSSWAPPRVRNAAAQRLAAQIPPRLKDHTAQTVLREFAASAKRSPTAVLQDWLFPEGIHIVAADATPPYTWIVWERLTLAPKAYFLVPELALAEEAMQWLHSKSRNVARRNLLGWAPDGTHGRRRAEDDRLWTEVKASPHHKAGSRRPGHNLDLLPTDTLAPETLVEIQDLLHALNTLASLRERQVLDLLCSGVSLKDIPRQLSIPRSQVDQYVFRLRKKFVLLKAG